MRDRLTDKGLVIGFTAADLAPAPAEAEVVTENVEAPKATGAEVEDEAPFLEAEIVAPEEAPRRGRGRPRKVIE